MSTSLLNGLAGRAGLRGLTKLTRQERDLFATRDRDSALEIVTRLDPRQCERVIVLAMVALGSIVLCPADCEHISWMIGVTLAWRARIGETGPTAETLRLIADLPETTREQALAIAETILQQRERFDGETLDPLKTLRDALQGNPDGSANTERVNAKRGWVSRAAHSITLAVKAVFPG